MQTAIRDAIVAFIDAPYKAAFPTVPIVYGNGPFDWNNPPAEFTEVNVEFHTGSQVGMSSSPKTRLRGHVYFSACTRLGSGARGALQALDWLGDRVAYARVGTVQMQARDPDGSTNRKGWYVEQLKVAFFSDPA